MLSNFLKTILGAHSRAARRHAAALERGCAAYAAGRYDEAREAAEDARRALAGSADASYLLGLCACAAGDPQSAAVALERAIELGDGSGRYVAALADARLLQQREDDAEVLYRRAFPELAREVAAIGEPPSPWKKAHPDWTSRLTNLSLPGPGASAEPQSWRPASLDDTRAAHILNWGLLLIRRRRARAGMYLIGEALRTDAGLGYGHAVLALMHTLDQAWPEALAAGLAARELGSDAFAGATDLCIVSAQLGLGYGARELDAVFDWQPLGTAHDERYFDALPALHGTPFPAFTPCVVVYLVCCDPDYLLEHALALAYSIRDRAASAALHLHLFGPTPDAWHALDKLRAAIAPVSLSVTWESVQFDQYGGKSLYCACARFARLHQLVLSTPNRVVMFDADSLLRADLAPALADRRDIALVVADYEPPWHRYPAFCTAFTNSPETSHFLGRLGAFLATNLVNGKARYYLDQLGLYACTLLCGEQVAKGIEILPVQKFCDSLFSEEALAWTVTQNKNQDSPFAEYKRALLARYDAPPETADVCVISQDRDRPGLF